MCVCVGGGGRGGFRYSKGLSRHQLFEYDLKGFNISLKQNQQREGPVSFIRGFITNILGDHLLLNFGAKFQR